jgi:hypothetical protein
MSTQLNIQDEVSESINVPVPTTLADALALIDKLTQENEELSRPVARTRKFKISTDGRVMVFGTGIKMTREQAEWLVYNSKDLLAFLAANDVL